MIFELIRDFADMLEAMPAEHPRRRILALLDEAIRRDVHFIDRHPTTLFQCLWNSCWWYDCPEAAQHYELPAEGQKTEAAPWERTGPRLSPLLAGWRTIKEENPSFAWLRSLRPPPLHLGTAQKAVLLAHEALVSTVAYSADGRRIASGSWDKTVWVWDAATGAGLLWLRGHKHQVDSVAVSPDGRWIASGSNDGTVRVWDAANGALLLSLVNDSAVSSVAFAPEARRLASSGRTVRIWDAASGAPLHCLRGHENWVASVAFSADGRLLASGSEDKTVRIWDSVSGAQILCLRGHEGAVLSVAFAPKGSQLASASEDRTVRVWDAASGIQLLCLHGHESAVTSVAFAPDGRRVASGSHDKTVQVWDTVSGAQLLCLRGSVRAVNSVAFAPDGRRIVGGCDDRAVRLWDATSDALLFRLRGHEDWVRSMACSLDGQRLASGSEDKTVRVWDTASGTELLCLRGHEHTVLSVAFAPDGRRLASGSADKTVRVWDAAGGTELLCLREHDDAVESVSYSPDARQLVSRSNRTVIHDAENGTCQEVIEGTKDDGVIATETPRFPWRAVVHERDVEIDETTIEDAASGEPITWFPTALRGFLTHPSGRTWVTSVDDYLCLFTLQHGGTACSPEEPSSQREP
jgi:WD40 repeat protein